jgi:lipoprotein signal peptidase
LTRTRALALALATCALVVAVDQAAKGLVVTQIARGDSVQVLPFLDFENTRNTGIAFGLAGDASPVLIGLTLVALIGLLAFIATRGGEGEASLWLPAGLLVGGALANLADRVREDAVIDFIDFPGWPTFNLADVAIVAGVVSLVLLSGRPEAKDKRAA